MCVVGERQEGGPELKHLVTPKRQGSKVLCYKPGTPCPGLLASAFLIFCQGLMVSEPVGAAGGSSSVAPASFCS